MMHVIKIKQYLFNTLVLVPPTARQPLITNLAIYDTAMGCVLGRCDESKEKTGQFTE